MNINDLTIGQAKELAALFDNIEKLQAREKVLVEALIEAIQKVVKEECK